MTLIDEITEEIKRSHTPKVPGPTEKKPEKKRRHKTPEEIKAYIAKKQAEEERRLLAKQAAERPKRGRKPKSQDVKGEISAENPVPQERPERKRGRKKVPESTCTKYRPKHVQTIDLPDGGSIVIIYMPGVP